MIDDSRFILAIDALSCILYPYTYIMVLHVRLRYNQCTRSNKPDPAVCYREFPTCEHWTSSNQKFPRISGFPESSRDEIFGASFQPGKLVDRSSAPLLTIQDGS